MNAAETSLRAETIEMEAWTDLLAMMPEATRRPLGAELGTIGGAVAICAKNLPLVTFNRVMGVGIGQPADAASLNRLIAYLRDKANPVVQVQVAPFAQPEGLESLLKANGLARQPMVWAKMGRPAGNGPSAGQGVDVELATGESATKFAQSVQRGFGMPPFFVPWLEAMVGRPNWRCYIVRSGGEPIGGGAMYLSGRDAWLGVAATVPDARRRGGQGALMARRIRDAAELGKDWVFTETGVLDGPNPSLANMRRAGFRQLHERANWALAT